MWTGSRDSAGPLEASIVDAHGDLQWCQRHWLRGVHQGPEGERMNHCTFVIISRAYVIHTNCKSTVSRSENVSVMM